jgi:hypothetical protein
MSTTQLERQNSAAAIFARLWEGENGSLSVPVARHVLKLEFGAEDKARIQELIERNREGVLTNEERDELDNFVKIGDLTALLQSKARQLLKQTTSRRAGHG